MQGFDPLSECADPRRYVPLATSEQILAALAEHVDAGASPILLTGPSGVGKTLLLHVLGEHARVAGQRVVYSPFLHLSADECARWLLHLLEIPPREGDSAEATLLDVLRAPDGRPTLLLVDEIQAAPEASVHRLAELARTGRPALTVVAAGSEGRHLRKRIPLLAPEATLHFPKALPDDEIGALYGAILERPELSPHVRRALSPERDEIMRAASGLPRLLKAELDVRAHNFTVRGGPRKRLRAIEELCLDTWVAPEPAEPPEEIPVASAVVAYEEAAPPARATAARWAAADAIRAQAAAAMRAAAASPMRARAAIHAWATNGMRAAAARATRARAAVGTICTDAARAMRCGAAQAIVSGAARTLRARAALGVLRARMRGALRAGASVAVRETRSGRERLLDAVRQANAAARMQRDVALARGARARRAVHGAAIDVRDLAAAALRELGGALFRAGEVVLPALALCALVFFLNSDFFGLDTAEIARTEGTPAVDLVPSDPAPVEALLAVPAVLPVQAQINARPWARIRIDGVDVGPTPLSRPLAPGFYEIEAVFADGRSLQRRVEIAPERRFVALP